VVTMSGRWVARDLALSIQCVCAGLVALGAAYASYRHGREFALHFGADELTAAIWPLIVDGLLTTVELWKPSDGRRWAAWTARSTLTLHEACESGPGTTERASGKRGNYSGAGDPAPITWAL
jgi:hypothetical protein